MKTNDKLFELEDQFYAKRRQSEAKYEDIVEHKQKGIAIIEEVADRTEYFVRDILEDPTILSQGWHQLEYLEEDFIVECQQAQKQVEDELEELEVTFRREWNRLEESS